MSRHEREEEEPWECDAEILRESDSGAAWLIRFETGDERWVPKSVVHDNSEVYDLRENREGKLVLKGWWARKEGLS